MLRSLITKLYAFCVVSKFSNRKILILSTEINKNLILNALKVHYNFKSDREFAKFLEIAPTTMSSWYSRGSINWDVLFAKCVDVDFNKLIKDGVAETAKKNRQYINYDKDHYSPLERQMVMESPMKRGKTRGIPFVEPCAVGGFGSEDFSIGERDVKDYYVIPKFKDRKIDFMIEVYGSSMYPKYNSGDIVACTIIRNSNFIQWNKVHVIATKEQGILIKRLDVSEKDGFLKAISDNKDYRPFDIPLAEITGIAIVVGVVRLE